LERCRQPRLSVVEALAAVNLPMPTVDLRAGWLHYWPEKNASKKCMDSLLRRFVGSTMDPVSPADTEQDRQRQLWRSPQSQPLSQTELMKETEQ
jgi:hypothetical protein